METPATDFVLARTAEEARPHVERLAGLPLVGLDTETFHVPAEDRWQLSLVQVSAGQGPVLIVDALTVPPSVLVPLVEARRPLKVAHSARYDVATLRSVGLRPRGFVDTLRLAQWCLWMPGYRLADVVRELFGVELDKQWQRSDWGRRPLLPAQLAYAAADARWAFRAAETLRERLEQSARWPQALAQATVSEHTPLQRRPLPGPLVPPLTPAEEWVLAALRRWRLETARQAQLPAYMVVHDRTLELLARERPRTPQALRALKGFGKAKVQRYGAGLLETLARALAEAGADDPGDSLPSP